MSLRIDFTAPTKAYGRAVKSVLVQQVGDVRAALNLGTPRGAARTVRRRRPMKSSPLLVGEGRATRHVSLATQNASKATMMAAIMYNMVVSGGVGFVGAGTSGAESEVAGGMRSNSRVRFGKPHGLTHAPEGTHLTGRSPSPNTILDRTPPATLIQLTRPNRLAARLSQLPICAATAVQAAPAPATAADADSGSW